MTSSSEIQVGDSLRLSADQWAHVVGITNSSSGMSERYVAAKQLKFSVVDELFWLISGMPKGQYEEVQITAVDPQFTIDSNIRASEPSILRFDLPLELARSWFPIAEQTIDFLGDPETFYLTGWTTDELRSAAKLLSAENWRPEN